MKTQLSNSNRLDSKRRELDCVTAIRLLGERVDIALQREIDACDTEVVALREALRVLDREKDNY